MNIYGGFHDYSLYLYDLGATDPTFIESLARTSGLIDGNGDQSSSCSSRKIGPESSSKSSPPKHHRHDGTSPLPLGMDWSPPPRIWEGRNSVWPHDFHTGWSYCVTVPSWTIIPKARGLDPIVFYRVQVGIQSPEGITSSRRVLRRFSDFMNLSSDLKKEFPNKRLPPAPPKRLLRMKSKDLMEERRYSLGDWIEQLLSDIDISRSVTIAIFLELEAAARSAFYVANQDALDENSLSGFVVPSDDVLNYSDGSLVVGSSFASDNGNDSGYDGSELGTPRHGLKIHSELGVVNSTHDPELSSASIAGIMDEFSGNNDVKHSKESVQGYGKILHDEMSLRSNEIVIDQHTLATNTLQVVSRHEGETGQVTETEKLSHATRVSGDSLESEMSEVGPEFSEDANVSKINDVPARPEIFPPDLSIIVPTEDQNKMNRILTTMQQRITTARTDVEDLIARLNQELAVRQYLSTKVQDLEVELETMKLTREESLQQAIVVEKERVTQVQWDMDELRRKCMEMELKLKDEQEEKALLESSKKSIALDNERLRQGLDVAREQVTALQKHNEDLEVKSKLDLKILAKEVKSLRSSQSELRQEIVRLTKEKVEAERIIQEERRRREHTNAANAKLLHECEILRSRLEECRVSFLIEEENKLTIDASTPSEAIDILGTSDNRIGLLLAEAQLLAKDVENIMTSASSHVDGGHRRMPDDEIRKMLTDVLVDIASLQIQVNSVIRCAISAHEPEKDAEETSSRESLLGRFLDR